MTTESETHRTLVRDLAAHFDRPRPRRRARTMAGDLADHLEALAARTEAARETAAKART